MIERLNNNEGVKRSETAAGQRELLREYRNKLNEVIDFVNDHEQTIAEHDDLLYGCDNDDDDLEECPGCCPECGGAGHVPDGKAEEAKAASVNTKDGLFADFAAYVAEHPALRFWQALVAWSGYNHIFGTSTETDITGFGDSGKLRYRVESDSIEDTFYKTTKGPKL
jgi:hypothetical protein